MSDRELLREALDDCNEVLQRMEGEGQRKARIEYQRNLIARITARVSEPEDVVTVPRDEWIDASVQMPEPHKRVLCKSDFAFVGGYEPDKNAFSVVNDVYVPVGEVKMWQPLPAPPKG